MCNQSFVSVLLQIKLDSSSFQCYSVLFQPLHILAEGMLLAEKLSRKFYFGIPAPHQKKKKLIFFTTKVNYA